MEFQDVNQMIIPPKDLLSFLPTLAYQKILSKTYFLRAQPMQKNGKKLIPNIDPGFASRSTLCGIHSSKLGKGGIITCKSRTLH
jgi:hypothetical protein